MADRKFSSNSFAAFPLQCRRRLFAFDSIRPSGTDSQAGELIGPLITAPMLCAAL